MAVKDRLSVDEIKKLVKENNKSKQFSDEFIVSLIYKETDFDPTFDQKPPNTARGLMQVTKGAVEDVNKSTPKGIHYEYDDLKDAAKNIQCGTYYLDIRVSWSKDRKKAVDGYGTGEGYSDKIFECEKRLQDGKENPNICLMEMHQPPKKARK